MASRVGVPTYAEIMEVQRDVRECVRAMETIMPLVLPVLAKHEETDVIRQVAAALEGTPWELVH